MFNIISLFIALTSSDVKFDEGCGLVTMQQGSTVTVMYTDHYEMRVDSRLDVGDEFCPVDAPMYIASK